jgi:hypothetical protein
MRRFGSGDATAAGGAACVSAGDILRGHEGIVVKLAATK